MPHEQENKPNAVVVGGGVGGRAAALVLAKHGFATGLWDPKGARGGAMGGKHQVTVWNNGWAAWEQLTGLRPLGRPIESFEHRTARGELLWRLPAKDLPGGLQRTRLVLLDEIRQELDLAWARAIGTGELLRKCVESIHEEVRTLEVVATATLGAVEAAAGSGHDVMKGKAQDAIKALYGAARTLSTLIRTLWDRHAAKVDELERRQEAIFNSSVALVKTAYATERVMRDMLAAVVKPTADGDWLQSSFVDIVQRQLERLARAPELERLARLMAMAGDKKPEPQHLGFEHFTEKHGEVSTYASGVAEPTRCEVLVGAGGKACPVRRQLFGDEPEWDFGHTLFSGWTEDSAALAGMDEYLPETEKQARDPHGSAPRTRGRAPEEPTRVVGFVGRELWLDMAWIAEDGKPGHWFWIACVRGPGRRRKELHDAVRELPVPVQRMVQLGKSVEAPETGAPPRGFPLADLHPPARMAHGPVALLGDAAHGVSLILGQSVGLALEDAAVLQDALEQQLERQQLERINKVARRAKIHRALAAYSRRRTRRTIGINNSSHQLVQLAMDSTLPDPLRRALETITMPMASFLLGDTMLRFDAKRSF